MKRLLVSLVLVVAVSSLFCSCASIRTARQFNGLDLTVEKTTAVENLNASVSGLYLLGRIPILTGDTRGGGIIAFNKDTASLEECVDYMTKRAKADGAAKVVDLVSQSGSQWLGPAGFFVLWWKNASVSANGLK